MMEKDCKNKSQDLQINVRTRNKVKFKAGAELSKSVNLVDVEWNEEVSDTHEVLEVKLHLRSEGCIAKVSDCEEE